MVRAKRSLGQNFLVDPNLQRKIVDAVEPADTDTVLEIGPGTGALTRHLAGRIGRLVAVELDDRLATALREKHEADPHVEIVHADALERDPAGLVGGAERYKVVGNIPYNITSPLLFHLLDTAPRPELIVVMVQKEVADRILADPGTRTYGSLSVGIRALAAAERLFNVGRGAFRPVPDVESTVLRITPYDPPPLTADEEVGLRDLTRAAFGWRRKQLQKTLRSSPEYGLDVDEISALEQRTGLDLNARPETLAPDDFIDLSRALGDMGHPATRRP